MSKMRGCGLSLTQQITESVNFPVVLGKEEMIKLPVSFGARFNDGGFMEKVVWAASFFIANETSAGRGPGLMMLNLRLFSTNSASLVFPTRRGSKWNTPFSYFRGIWFSSLFFGLTRGRNSISEFRFRFLLKSKIWDRFFNSSHRK